MYVLRKSLYPEEFQHKNYVSKLFHKFVYNEEIDSMVIVTSFSYDFFDFDGPSIATVENGAYSGCSTVTLLISQETNKIDFTSHNKFTENSDFIAILDEVKEYYNLSLHITDCVNQFIEKEYLKPIQIKLNMLNKEDFKLFSTLNEYIDNLELSTVSAGMRSIMNLGFTLRKHGVRISPNNKVYCIKEVTLDN